MGLPTISDLVLYVNKALTGNDWNTNWRKVINWLTDGKTEIKVKALEIAEGGELINNGSIQQTGDFDIGGNLTVGGNITTDGTITGDGSGLYNVTAASKFPYTTFCVNSGKVTDGAGDIIKATAVTSGGVITGYTVTFDIGDGNPNLEATAASGEHFTLTSLNSDTLASSGTFYYFVKKGESSATKLTNITIYRQPTTPAATVENNIWLDTSCEKLVCKKYSSGGQWEEWDYVPVGEVVVDLASNPATATVTTYAFNQNKYNLNENTPKIIEMTEAIKPISYAGKIIVIGSNSSGHPYGGGNWTATSDGYILVYLVGDNGNDDWLKIAGNTVLSGQYVASSGNPYRDGQMIGLLPVKKGQYIEIRSGGAYFFPQV